jgi:hypothetical protein
MKSSAAKLFAALFRAGVLGFFILPPLLLFAANGQGNSLRV